MLREIYFSMWCTAASIRGLPAHAASPLSCSTSGCRLSRRVACTCGVHSKAHGLQRRKAHLRSMVQLDGLHLRVDLAAKPRGHGGANAGGQAAASAGQPGAVLYDAARSVFVGNLPFDVQARRCGCPNQLAPSVDALWPRSSQHPRDTLLEPFVAPDAESAEVQSVMHLTDIQALSEIASWAVSYFHM